jgi:hypothetical protein
VQNRAACAAPLLWFDFFNGLLTTEETEIIEVRLSEKRTGLRRRIGCLFLMQSRSFISCLKLIPLRLFRSFRESTVKRLLRIILSLELNSPLSSSDSETFFSTIAK